MSSSSFISNKIIMRRLLHTVKWIQHRPIVYTEVDGQGTYVSPWVSTTRVYKAFPNFKWNFTVSIEWNFQFILQYLEWWTWWNIGSWVTSWTYTFEEWKTYGVAVRYPDNSNITPTGFVNWNGKISIQPSS